MAGGVSSPHPMRAAGRAAQAAASAAEPWSDRVARLGYIAKGAVFLLVGGLALAAAAGFGGETTDPSGARATVARASVGRLALAGVALGLLAHAAFRVALVIMGEPYADGGTAQRTMRRLSNAGSAIIYMGLAGTAGALAAGWNGLAHTDKEAETRHWSARLLEEPYGRPLLLAVAAAIVAAAVVQLALAMGPNHVRRRLRVEEMTERQCRMVVAVGRVAHVARATVLGVIGYFLARAGIERAPGVARGPAGALHAVWEQPHGDLLLAMVAAGLIAFGAYGLLEARWRRLIGR